MIPDDGDQIVRVIMNTGGDVPTVPMAGAVLRGTAALIEINDVPVHRQPRWDLHCAVLAWSLAANVLHRKHYDPDSDLQKCNVKLRWSWGGHFEDCC